MAQVISFTDYTPAARYDEIAWTEARIEEASSEDGPWTQIDVIALDPLDADPAVPAARSFTTELASDDADLWYRVVFADVDSDTSQATGAIQNIARDVPTVEAYATVEELFRILKIRQPTAEQEAAGERVLLTAAGEIRSETGLDDLEGWQLALAAEVNLERAVEHWRQQESPFGLVGLGAEMGSSFVARDSWERHAHKLAPLKTEWGIA